MNILKNFSAALGTGVAVVALMAGLSAPASAQEACLQWGVNSNGFLWLSQSNNGGASLELKQNGSNLTGTGSYWYAYDTGGIGVGNVDYRTAYGTVVGTLKGNAFEATVYWSNKSVGIYTGQIGPQGLVVGKTYDKTDPAARADFNSREPLECLKREKGGLILGRVTTTSSPETVKSVCEAAKSARARNSPAAPGLERHCAALTPKAPGLATAPLKPPVALGLAAPRSTAPASTPICDAAQSARARNSPAAPGLERQCKALQTNPEPSSPAVQASPSNGASQNSLGAMKAPANEAQVPKSPLSR